MRSLRRLPGLLLPILACSCQLDVLDPRGFVGASEKTILIDSLIIMLAIVIPTITATLGFAFWFRASNTRATYRPDWAHSGQVELVTWSIPLLVIVLLGGVAWVGSHELDPAVPLDSKTPPLDIQVVSLDWKWLFIYPGQHVAAVNQLVIPAGVPIHLSLTSASVMNAFFVPQLGSMIYTMNHMADQLNLIADRPGTFRGLSSHYSGDGFAGMHFDVHAVPAADFTAWVTSSQATGPGLDTAGYTQLEKQSQDVAPMTYRDVEAGLFEKIVTQAIPPSSGPQTGIPSQNVSPRTEH